MPGQANTASTTTADEIRSPSSRPAMVTIGTSALRSPCTQTMRAPARPLARAVRMKSLAMTAPMPEAVRRLRRATLCIASVAAGRIRCDTPP